ncbi:DNA helicase [Trifolium repens]|nr:DNA helicase [Trifolium repens]
MNTCYDLEYLPSLGTFTTIWIKNKIYGEVDPAFYGKFQHALGEEWNIFDIKKTHSVKFNKDLIFPLLKEGWSTMKDAFGFTDFQEITLSYIGKDNFLLISSKPLKDLDDIPLYHSRAIKFGYTNKYLIRLSTENINKPYLNIFGAFEGFVRFYDFKFLTVCCDNGSKTTFKIASTELPFKTTSIGLG